MRAESLSAWFSLDRPASRQQPLNEAQSYVAS